DAGATEENLVGEIKLAAIDRALDDVEVQLAAGEFHDAVAGDAFQDVVGDGGGDELALAHHEQVAGGTFGDVAILVEEDSFVVSVGAGLVAGESAVGVGAGDFAAAGDGEVVHAAPGGDGHLHALIGAGDVLAVGDGGDEPVVVVVAMDANAGRGLVGEGADVEVGLELVAPGQFGRFFTERFGRGLHFDAEQAAVVEPAAVVFLGAVEEELAFLGVPVGADAFKHAGAVMQGVSKDIDVGVGQA